MYFCKGVCFACWGWVLGVESWARIQSRRIGFWDWVEGSELSCLSCDWGAWCSEETGCEAWDWHFWVVLGVGAVVEGFQMRAWRELPQISTLVGRLCHQGGTFTPQHFHKLYSYKTEILNGQLKFGMKVMTWLSFLGAKKRPVSQQWATCKLWVIHW